MDARMEEDVADGERAAFVRELHDAITHAVSQIHVHAAALRSVGPTERPASVEAIRVACGAAMHDLRRMHEVIRVDAPAPYEPQPTLASLQELIVALRAGGTAVEFELGGCSVPPSTAAGAHQIVRDVLDQAGALPGVRLERVDVRESGGQLDVVLLLRAAGTAAPPTFDLVRAGARARLLGGTLRVGADGAGMAGGSAGQTIVVALPLEVLS